MVAHDINGCALPIDVEGKLGERLGLPRLRLDCDESNRQHSLGNRRGESQTWPAGTLIGDELMLPLPQLPRLYRSAIALILESASCGDVDIGLD